MKGVSLLYVSRKNHTLCKLYALDETINKNLEETTPHGPRTKVNRKPQTHTDLLQLRFLLIPQRLIRNPPSIPINLNKEKGGKQEFFNQKRQMKEICTHM